MSLYGALNIGVAGLSANSAALSATSSNIANVNTVGYKEATASFHTYPQCRQRAWATMPRPASRLGSARTSPPRACPPRRRRKPTCRFRATASSWSRPIRTAAAPRDYTRAGSFKPDVNGNLVNSAGLYLMGYKLDSAGNVPTDASALSLVNTSSISGAAQATSSSTSRPI